MFYVVPLTSEERRQGGYTHRAVIGHADLTEAVANTAQTLAIYTCQPGEAVYRAALFVRTALSDASDAAFNSTTVTVGDDGDVDRYIASTQLNVNGTEVLFAVNPTATVPYVYTVANTIDVIITSMAAKSLSELDGGSFTVLLTIVNLNEVGPQ